MLRKVEKYILILFCVIVMVSCKDTGIPGSFDKCFVELEKNLPEEELEKFKNTPERKAVAGAHFGLGLWIRNNWIRPDGSPLATKLFIMGLRHPDDMSGVILTSFWRHLNNKPLDINKQILQYKEYWKYELVPENAVSPKDGAKIMFLTSEPCNEKNVKDKCRVHLGFSESDGSIWAYSYGKGVVKPTAKQIEYMNNKYKYDVKSKELQYLPGQ